jgi:hypothetical protein
MGPWTALDAGDNNRDLVRLSSVVGMEVVVWSRAAREQGNGGTWSTRTGD